MRFLPISLSIVPVASLGMPRPSGDAALGLFGGEGLARLDPVCRALQAGESNRERVESSWLPRSVEEHPTHLCSICLRICLFLISPGFQRESITIGKMYICIYIFMYLFPGT